MSTESERQMEVTGVFFTAYPTSWAGQIISLWTRSVWHHVGFVLTDGLTVEATPSRGVFRGELPGSALVVDLRGRYSAQRRALWAASALKHVGERAPYDFLGILWVGVTLAIPFLRRYSSAFGRNGAYFCSECVQFCSGIVSHQTPEATTPSDIARVLGVDQYA